MSAPSYALGDVVTASLLRVENVRPDAVPVELKIWLRLFGGCSVPARNEGADGSLVMPGATSRDFGPRQVMGVSAEIAPGLYEFGCRLLDPVTGKQLAEDSELFEIR